jgi:TonB family protein
VAGTPTLDCGELATWEAEGSHEPPALLNREEVLQRLAEGLSDPPAGTLRALVDMRVTRTGSVDRACVVESSGYGPFDRAAVEAAFLLRFRPGTTDGEPRSVSIRLPFAVNVR